MLTANIVLGFATLAFGQKACEPIEQYPEPDTNANTSPPDGALVVGSEATYTTIQAAVDALSYNTTEEQVIFINPGNYSEQVYIQALHGPLTVYGYTKDMSSYEGNQVTILAGESQETQPNNDETATLRVHTENFKLYNVDIINTWGIGSQAVALSAQATNQGYYGAALHGYQDTLLANSGRQIYASTLISGATDFIFGQRASAWFDNCSIRVVAAPAAASFITASGRSTNDSNWYVIHNSSIAALDGQEVEDGSYTLGRPWRNHSRVVFQFTEMSEVIAPQGWSVWNEGDERIEQVFYGEFMNSGPGSEGERVEFATLLEEPVDAATVLGEGFGEEFYVDGAYLS